MNPMHFDLEIIFFTKNVNIFLFKLLHWINIIINAVISGMQRIRTSRYHLVYKIALKYSFKISQTTVNNNSPVVIHSILFHLAFITK